MQQTPRDQYICIGDVKIRYWNLGSEGSIVVLLHGIGSCVETWTFNVEALAQRHQVYALDLVGSGRSDKPDISYSLTDLTNFVKSFMDALGIARASLIGNSMGGGIALQFALSYPQQVEKLVLVNSLGLGQEISLSLRLANLPLADKVYKPTRLGTASALKQCVYNQSLITTEWIELYYEIAALPGAQAALFALIRANIDWMGVQSRVYQPIVDRLPTITAPTLTVWGKQDRVIPVRHAQAAAQRLPNAQLHLFDNCGHWTQVEQAEPLNALILGFLSNL